ncbi:PHP domain-containing protein [Catenulispora yoronensis]|uniref:PHP domain-containing protein n=1 Tax=Catenulispora yoronensis TaxID=450799 RepID=A0ABN2UAC5_9ACTN
MRIDLHAHTTASDGTYDPAELVPMAEAAGLTVVAITDHDGVGGWAEAHRALTYGREAGVWSSIRHVVPGVEISCKIRDIGLHLLGYLFDPEDAALDAALGDIRDSRTHRAEAMVAKARELGAPITWERVQEIAGDGVVGRPHVASALVEVGVVASVDDAFGPDWLGENGRARVDKNDMDPFRAIDLVRAAGGVTVMAHPLAWRRGPIVTDDDIAAFAEAGLTGIEMNHPDHGPKERDQVRGLATELGLLTTGSSDWHGSRKSTPLGAETTDPEVYEELVSRASGIKPF